MEIPCYFLSQINRSLSSKLTRISMTIPSNLSSFYLFSMLKHEMDFGQVQVMEFLYHLLRKWWDFHRSWSHFQPNCRPKDKNVTSIPMKTPCHFKSQIDGSFAKIDTKFHVIYPEFFICFACWNMTWILENFKSWNFYSIC